jgi:hypothetical protein
MVELFSGVDALYLSGRASLPSDLLDALEEARNDATTSGNAVSLDFGSEEFYVAPHGFQRYRFCLDHPFGRVGISTGSHLPTFRVQPRTEFIQGSGPQGVVNWYRRLLEEECGPVLLSVSRLDLCADFQRWALKGDSRHEFVTRAKSRHTYEEDGVFNGLIFGSRNSGSILARIYDKTIESEKSGSAYWRVIWGERFDQHAPVLRVEFELGRSALREFGVNTPEQALDAAGSLWGSLTTGWLTHRVPTPDNTRTRWPVSPQWESVRRARIGQDDWGIARMYAAKQQGGLFNLMPPLAGYLARFGALTNSTSFADLLPHLSDYLARYARDSGKSLGERISEKHRTLGLP